MIFFVGNLLFSQNQEITAFTEEFPPYNYLVDGKPAGLAVEALNLLSKESGVGIKLQFVPWARALEEARTGRNTLVFSMAMTDERKPNYRWILKINDLKSVIYRLTARVDLKNVSLERLKTFGSIAVVKNDPAGRMLQSLGIPTQRIHEIQDLPDRSRTALSVELGHDDFFVSPPIFHRFEVNRGTRKDIFTPQVLLPTQGGLYIAGSLGFDGAILDKITAAADSLIKSGAITDLRSRYLPPGEE